MYSERYLENEVRSADPIGLVVLLYDGAIRAVRRARERLLEGKIAERSDAITKAMQIVTELQGSLDLERGGEIAQSLAELYAFVQERLIHANAAQRHEPLEEALRVLEILNAGWTEIGTPAPMPAPPVPEVIEAGSMAWTL